MFASSTSGEKKSNTLHSGHMAPCQVLCPAHLCINSLNHHNDQWLGVIILSHTWGNQASERLSDSTPPPPPRPSPGHSDCKQQSQESKPRYFNSQASTFSDKLSQSSKQEAKAPPPPTKLALFFGFCFEKFAKGFTKQGREIKVSLSLSLPPPPTYI